MWDYKLIKGERDEGELYRKMYYMLFNAITDAMNIEDKQVADELLRQAQMKAEDVFID